MSADEARERFFRYMQEKEPGKETVYKRFLGTLLASTSDEGTEHFVNPAADSIIATELWMLESSDTKGRIHATNDLEHHVAARVSDVCHGRRLFLCGVGQDANGRNLAGKLWLVS